MDCRATGRHCNLGDDVVSVHLKSGEVIYRRVGAGRRCKRHGHWTIRRIMPRIDYLLWIDLIVVLAVYVPNVIAVGVDLLLQHPFVGLGSPRLARRRILLALS